MSIALAEKVAEGRRRELREAVAAAREYNRRHRELQRAGGWDGVTIFAERSAAALDRARAVREKLRAALFGEAGPPA